MESRKDNIDQSEPSTETKALTSSGPVGASAKDEKDSEGADIGVEEIVKELREIRKQNTVTHWLLSVLIVIDPTLRISPLCSHMKLKACNQWLGYDGPSKIPLPTVVLAERFFFLLERCAKM